MSRNKNIDNPLTVDRTDPDPLETQDFRLFESFQEGVLYGATREGLNTLYRDLVHTGFLAKAARYRSLPDTHKFELPAQWQLPAYHDFLEAALASRESHLVYEWSQLLRQRKGAWPAHVLVLLMDWGCQELRVGEWIAPVIGNLGAALADRFPVWNLLSATSCQNPAVFKKPDQRAFAFQQFRNREPVLAFRYFLMQAPKLKEPERRNWMRLLAKSLGPEEVVQLQDELDLGKLKLAVEWQYLASMAALEINPSQARSKFISALRTSGLDGFIPDGRHIPGGKWSAEQIVRSVPVLFLTEKAEAEAYLKWIYEKELQEQLWSALKELSAPVLAEAWFDRLLNEGALTEDQPLEILSQCLDHARFNRLSLRWIEKSGDALDLEAFLRFLSVEKQFWTDELLLAVLELRKSKVLDRRYDFTVFWQLLPYKINPGSEWIKAVPAECRMQINNQLHFESILHFRRAIRKK
ncbi:MAG TPA: hypothetical protein VFX48_08460 [Saprospiraceae bacterium]|nr:hypothetical protein [Saprospiraceae bacterium]